jgi:hypothetical protein
MPVKWKIFSALNIVHFILNAFIYASFCVQFFSSELSRLNAENWLGFFLFSLFFLILIGNNLTNQYILKKFFPDGEITRNARRVHNITGFFYSLFVILLLLLFINVTTDNIPETFGDPTRATDWFFGFHLFGGIALLIMQYGLKNSIDKLYYRKIAESIKKIGDTDDSSL